MRAPYHRGWEEVRGTNSATILLQHLLHSKTKLIYLPRPVPRATVDCLSPPFPPCRKMGAPPAATALALACAKAKAMIRYSILPCRILIASPPPTHDAYISIPFPGKLRTDHGSTRARLTLRSTNSAGLLLLLLLLLPHPRAPPPPSRRSRTRSGCPARGSSSRRVVGGICIPPAAGDTASGGEGRGDIGIGTLVPKRGSSS